MKKLNKKHILMGVGILLLLCLIAAGIFAATHFSKPAAEAVIDAVTDGFDEEYTSIQMVDADPFMSIDGVLDEDVWAGKKAFTNRFSDDLSGMKASIEIITHMTEKGVYVGATAYDTNLVYNGLNAPRKNSTLQLSIASPDSDGTMGVHRVYMDAERVVSTSNANVASCAYGVKVDGELGSGMTQKMTMELFLPWDSIGMDYPEDPAAVEILLSPCYNAIESGRTTSHQLRTIPFSATSPRMFLRFAQDGFVDADAEGALIGNSKYGVAKVGSWDVTGIAVDETNTDANTLSYTGRAKTAWGSYHMGYLTQAAAENYVFEATVVPVSSEVSEGTTAYAGLAAMLPGEKQLSMRMVITKPNIKTNANGENNIQSIVISRVYQDYENGVYDALQVIDETNSSFNTQEGVKLKYIKNGAQYFLYANDTLIWAGVESRANGIATPAFLAGSCQVEYKDIRFTNFDGRTDELEKELERSNTCLIRTEVEGSGEITADSIAVSKGGSTTVTVSAMPQYILTDLLVNGKSVMADFHRNAFFEGTENLYTIKNVQGHTTIKAVFEEYEGTAVSGNVSIAGETDSKDLADTRIYAYLSDRRVLEFTSAVAADGSYSISLPAGTYSKIYFQQSRYEEMFSKFSDGTALKVGAEELTGKDFVLTWPTFDSFVSGPTLQTGDWYIVDNGTYFADGNTAANNYNTAYFRDSKSNDFLVKTRIKAEPGAMVGVMMYGNYYENDGYQMLAGFTAGGNYAITLFGWHGTARPVNWIGTTTGAYKSNALVYPSTNIYDVVLGRKGETVTMFINGVRVATWSGLIEDYDGVEFDMSKFNITKVGLSIRGYKTATFSDYSYTTDMAEIDETLSCQVSFDDLPEGVTVTSGGKAVTSGEKISYGQQVDVKFPVNNGKAYKVTVNRAPVTAYCYDGVAYFTVKTDSVISVTECEAFTVSGTVLGGYNGTVTATSNETGAKYNFANALKNGEYSIYLPNGNYQIYFGCSSREGMLDDVIVSGKNLQRDLYRTYPKLMVTYMGAAANTGGSGMVRSNSYYLSGVKNANANAVGYFNTTEHPVNDFLIKTHVSTNGGEVGIMMYGYDGNKTNPDVQINLQKNGSLSFYGWGIGWQDRVKLDTTKYNPNSFDLWVLRKGNMIQVYIDGNLMHTWDGTGNLDISKLTNLRVGLLVRGKIGATFSYYTWSFSDCLIDEVLERTITFDLPEGLIVTSGGKTLKSGDTVLYGDTVTVTIPEGSDYVYSFTVNGEPVEYTCTAGQASFVIKDDSLIEAVAKKAYTVTGTVPAGVTGTITATETTTGETYVYEDILSNGAYSIQLPSGTFDLYFDCGTTEGMVTDVTVADADTTAKALTKTYQKLTPHKVGSAGTAEWVLTDNGRYEVQTSNAGGDSIAMGWFEDGINLGKTDFVIETNVEASGSKAAMIGLAISNSSETTVFGLNNANYTAQIRALLSNGWPGFKNVAAYDRTNYRLSIVKQGDTITYFINGKQAVQWTTADYDFSGWTNTKVGLGFYRMYDVTFSDYSYSSDAADIQEALSRTVTFGTLPEGVTVKVDGKDITSGSKFPVGTEVTIGNMTAENATYTVKVNGEQILAENGTAKFTLDVDAELEVTVAFAYEVSGTIAGNASGSITATNAAGEKQVFDDALKDGSYSIRLSDGTYKLYFDCGDREGLIPAVTVNGAAVANQNLDKTYQKLTPYKEGAAGTANWVLVDNGCYEVQTSNTSTDSITMGWFVEGVNMSATDFVIDTQVEAAGNKAVMIGLAINGKNAAGRNETTVFGLNNSNYSAQIRALLANGWPGYKNVPTYDRTNFHLTILKQGNTITYFIDGTKACQWTTTDYNFAGWTDTKVGLGFYRMYDVTFSEYSYSSSASDVAAATRTVSFGALPDGATVSVNGKTIASGASVVNGSTVTIGNLTNPDATYTVKVNGQEQTITDGSVGFAATQDTTIEVSAEYAYLVSGTIGGGVSGTITATDVNGATYTGTLTNGSYSIRLPDGGTYKLYFDCGATEGLIPAVTVNGAAVPNQNLSKTYPKLTVEYMGSTANGTSELIDNGVHTISGVNNGNANAIGYFAGTYNDFVVSARVQTTGQAGIMMYGYDGNSGNPDVHINLQQNGYLSFYGWGISWKGGLNLDTSKYDTTNYVMTVVRQGTTIKFYIDGTLMHTWTESNAGITLAQLTDLRVGLYVRGTVGATFSDYSISSDPGSVKDYAVTFGTLPDSVNVSVNGQTITSGSAFFSGTEVTIGNLTNPDATYTVKVNGQEQTIENGTVSFTLTEDATIEVVTTAYRVSGYIGNGASGDIIVTDAGGVATTYTGGLANGSYSLYLPDGTYKLYFDCGTTEGLIPEVVVSGAAVTKNLTKTYQKLNILKVGTAGTANWVLVDNGSYEVQTSNASADSISMGWMADGITLNGTDFVVSTYVEAAGTKSVMIGLAMSGVNANGAARSLVYGLNNANYTAQCRVLENNTWPGYRDISYQYNRTSFRVTYIKQGDTITCYVDGTQVAQWVSDSSNFVFLPLTNTKIGIGFYRMYDVTFSDYIFSTDADVIASYKPQA